MSRLNVEQQLAVKAKECTLLLAGAGSGKTTVLTQRIADLIYDGCDPSRIIATTFSNKAAAEIKLRASNLTGGLAEGVAIGTFHSLAGRFLRQALKKDIDDESLLIDNRLWTSEFTIYDQTDSRSLFEEVCKSFDIDKKSIAVYEGCVSLMMNKGYWIDCLLTELIQKANNLPPVASDLFKATIDKMSESNAMSYDLLLWNLVKLLYEHPVNRELLRYQYNHFLVDECQDMNEVQLMMVDALVYGDNDRSNFDWSGRDSTGERSLFLVGDIDQGIYSWRGAEPRLTIDLPVSHKANILRLENNYRSAPRILEIANALIENNKDRLPKTLIPCRSISADRQSLMSAIGDTTATYRWLPSEYDEAQWIAEKVKTAIQAGYKPSDIAVLFRTNSQSRVLESTLSGMSIPYKLVNAFKFYDRKEVRDILGYLILAQNKKNDTVFKRIINIPRRGIGGQTLNAIENLAKLRKQSCWQIVSQSTESLPTSIASKANLKSFCLIIEQLEAMKLSPTIINDVVQVTGYLKYLEGLTEDESQERSSNLAELQNAVNAHLESDKPNTVQAFLESIVFSEKAEEKDCLLMMTVHSSKGLEFPIVFLSGLEEDTFPSRRSVSDLEIEEERRLMYVGITRAMDFLYLSGSNFRYGRQCSPSRFLLEMKK